MLADKMLAFALYGAEWVLWLLLILGVLCVLIATERILYFVLNRAPGAAFQQALDGFLRGGARKELEQKLTEMKGLEARVLRAGLAANSPDAAEDAILGTLTFERLRMERGLLIIGTVASNAPFIGLFGTVLGIIKAFNDLSLQSDESASAVMAGISEALVATAIGLAVAIPAVILYNFLSRRIKEVCGQVESLGALMISRMRGEEA